MLKCRARDFTINEEILVVAVVNSLQALQVWHN